MIGLLAFWMGGAGSAAAAAPAEVLIATVLRLTAENTVGLVSAENTALAIVD
ncbi:MAG: hypothetical protein IPK75_18420 [Acidobacteria bacterium]|nr:hypothetical protein [Acidobacteriota bacterium]